MYHLLLFVLCVLILERHPIPSAVGCCGFREEEGLQLGWSVSLRIGGRYSFFYLFVVAQEGKCTASAHRLPQHRDTLAHP
jgi:hypothetical protein